MASSPHDPARRVGDAAPGHTGHAGHAGAPQSVRWTVVGVLALWTLLQVATLVVAAVRGGPTTYALAFFATAIACIVLGLATLVAWRWAVRGQSHGLVVSAPDVVPAPHLGLSGQEPPPGRW